MSFQEFWSELNGSRVEGELIRTILYSLITSFVILAIMYFVRFRDIENFMGKYGYFLFFAAISYSLIIPTIRQVRAYKQCACMTGMMIGMTIGMVAGFLAGFYIASTNGMFVGSIFGMIIGITLGIWMGGSCCGVMGFMEGIMAGFMGALMGAMTAFMLLNDNLKIITPIIFLVSAVILLSLNYMIYNEMKNEQRQRREDHFWTMAISFVLTLVTAWLMVFGPRTGIFG